MDEGVESCSYQQFDQKSATLSDFRNHRCIGANPGASNLRSRVPVSVSYGWQATRRLSTVARSAKADLTGWQANAGSRSSSTPLENDQHFKSAPSPSGKAEVCKTSIPGSNPGGASNFLGSIPETWVTDYSGDMGNSFGPKGLSIGSSLQL